MGQTKPKYIIATIKSWNIELAERFVEANPGLEVKVITDKDRLTCDAVVEFNPLCIFFPHWSWIVPAKIYKNFECVVFHMTDLPFGRGGSPLQNLIVRGIYQTRISAIRVVEQLDAGPVYLKRDLSLEGSAEQIFRRASEIVFKDMLPCMIKNKPVPVPQTGEITKFRRRTLQQSNIGNLSDNTKVYDYIRMLDAEGYPSAFLETPTLTIEFSNARLQKDGILATARIKAKDES
jgi:methionyl-tRNA formyltransferase